MNASDLLTIFLIAGYLVVFFVFCFGYGFYLGKQMFLLAIVLCLSGGVWAQLPLLLGAESTSQAFRLVGPWYWNLVQLVYLVTYIIVALEGFRIGRRRRQNPPKPKEAPAPLTFGNDWRLP